MSINDKLTYLNHTKTAIKQAIINKGVEVSDADTFRSYAEKIGEIEVGRGGSTGGEVIDAIIDTSALPIEKDKKVVVADIQATGQGAGAIMPFDITPYNTRGGSVSNLLQLRGEYPLRVNTNSSTGHAHIGYKKVGDRWEGKFFGTTFYGLTNPNDSFNLLYDVSNYRYFSGSSGKYWNPIKEQEETITFDEPLTSSLIANVTTRYFLTYDSKYLWAVHLNVANTSQSAANKGLICLYEITTNDDTGEVFAHKKTEELEITMQTGSMQSCTCSLNHYGIIVHVSGNASNITYVQYNEAEHSLTTQTGTGFWGSSSFYLTAFTKDWVMLRYSSYHRVYWGDIFTAGLQGWNFGTGTNGYDLARFGNTFYPLTNYFDGVGSTSMTFIKMPIDKEQPVPEDFIFNTVTCYSSDAGPYMIDEENCIMGSSWQNDCTQPLRFYNIPTNTRTESDPSRVPVMLLDDGTGYFFKNDKQILSGASLEVILPVNGSYNNGTVLHTITRSATPYPHQMLHPQGSISGGNGGEPRFGTLPMRYLDNGNGFIFQTYYYNYGTAGGTQRGWFFRRVDEDPIMLEWIAHRSLVVGQNKAYIGPRLISNTQYPLTVIDADGVRDYTPIGARNAPGVMFEFEGKLYLYQHRNNDRTYGGYNCCEIVLNDEDMTATYTLFDDGSVYSPMASYIIQDYMSSTQYPLSTYSSHYNQPVLTKDGKYYVGLAGNHTTHYAKIEKHESGYPILNVYEFPQQLKDLLYKQEILYFEAYYPSGFGIQLANGFFLLCEYEQGLDVDLTITTYIPAHSYTPSSYNQCLMHFTANKHYWYFSAGTYWSSGQGSVIGYAGCGRREGEGVEMETISHLGIY